MTPEEMKNEFNALYNYMASSQKVENMRVFGNVHKEMFNWFVENKPELAEEFLAKLESIKWSNFLTRKEADKIVSSMNPQAPWNYDQWKGAMEKHGYQMDEEPCYNSFALFVTMNMEMSDNSENYKKYVGEENLFDAVHDFAVSKLKDRDKRYRVREYFNV